MPLLEIRSLCKSYKNVKALKNMSVTVGAGEIVALLGTNGAGKTTLLNCIAGNIHPTSGDIVYKSETLLKEESRLNEFGILIEPTFIPYMNAYENLCTLLKATGEKDVGKQAQDLLALIGLAHKKKEKTKAFSFGMRQRLGLAQALLNKPGFLILDEPFVGLDPSGKKIFKDVILQKAREENVGILFSSHDLEDVEEICDRVVMIENGTKKFDGRMEYSKTFIVICDRKINETERNVLSDYRIENEKIMVTEGREIQALFSRLSELELGVVDMEIHQKSLYDLFDDEEEDVNED